MKESPRILIAYASLTGSTEEAAFLLKKEFEKLKVEADIDEMEMISAKAFSNCDICIIATYSYDSGGEILPDETMAFYEELGQLNLSGKIYGVMGSGQDFYEWYCGAVDKFDAQLEKTKARKGTENFKFEWDISEPEDKEKLNVFATQLIDVYRSYPQKAATIKDDSNK